LRASAWKVASALRNVVVACEFVGVAVKVARWDRRKVAVGVCLVAPANVGVGGWRTWPGVRVFVGVAVR
jgi:hypothetical protein